MWKCARTCAVATRSTTGPRIRSRPSPHAACDPGADGAAYAPVLQGKKRCSGRSWAAAPGEPRAGSVPARGRGSLLAVALHLFLGRRALLLAHFQEALALAGVLALARVVGALAGRLTLAGVHAGALGLGLGTRHGGADQAGAEEHGGGVCDGQAGAVFQSHWCIPRAVKISPGEARPDRRPGRAPICHAAAWSAAARVSAPSPNRRRSQ